MESVIFEASPIADYLKGEGQVTDAWAATPTAEEPQSPNTSTSFAPIGPSTRYRKGRGKPPPLNLGEPPLTGAVARIHTSISTALHSRLGWTENALFLEKFRYTIVASQLLNEYSNPATYQRSRPQPPIHLGQSQWEPHQGFIPSSLGLFVTGFIAFSFAWSVRWLYVKAFASCSRTSMSLFASAVVVVAGALYHYLRHQWLQYLRAQAVEGASLLTNSAQELDCAASAGITLIQEVELVSRGYNISNPLAPISRLEEVNQVKRCARLRRTIQRALSSMISPYYIAFQRLKPSAVELDLEKYYDIYEISRMDMDDAQMVAETKWLDTEDADTLQHLKSSLQKLHVVRKLLLCTLLALNADGSKSDFQRWSTAVDVMNGLSSAAAKVTYDIDVIMREEEEIQTPPTPKIPLTPARERMRSQMRQLGNLSQGIRGLQAKMRLLRDESDKALDQSEEISDSGTNLLSQYDSIGGDLKGLIQEWEVGRAALITNLDKKDHRRSLSTTSNFFPSSPTSSLGGATAVGGSPQEALQPLDKISQIARSRSSASTSSSGEEIFEAVALPRQRSTLTREERIAKMKEERMKQAVVQEKSHATTHMLKELETVIKLRPRGRTTGRLTDL